MTRAAVGLVLAALSLAGGNCSAAPAAHDGWIDIKVGKTFVVSAPPGTRYVPAQGIDSFVGYISGEPPAPDVHLIFDFGRYGPTVPRSDEPHLTLERYDFGRWTYAIATYPGREGCAADARLQVSPRGASKARDADYLVIVGCANPAGELPVLLDVLKSTRMLAKPGR